jgi:hypothetical protein
MASLENNSASSTTEKKLKMRYLLVKLYISNIHDHDMSKAKASAQAVRTLVKRDDNMSHRSYICRSVRRWATEFCEKGSITEFKQGHHRKHISFLADEDAKEQCIDWLRQCKPMKRDLAEFKAYIDKELLPAYNNGKPGNVSLRSIRTYVHKWGFKFRENSKGIYVDGHERHDVVEYRKAWAQRMMLWKKLMDRYDGESLEIVIEPNLDLPGNRKQQKVCIHCF